MWPDPQKTVDLVTFTEEILNGKLRFFVQNNLIYSCACSKHVKISQACENYLNGFKFYARFYSVVVDLIKLQKSLIKK